MKFFRMIFAITLLSCCLIGMCFPVAAESSVQIPFQSYTYWNNMSGFGRKAVYNRPLYEIKSVLDAASLGIEEFEGLMDVCTDAKGNVYLLDTHSRIVILDSEYAFVKEILSVKGQEEFSFEGARGLYVSDQGFLYICDTENKRVLCCDLDGQYIDTYTLPESPLIPSSFDFCPIRMVMDQRGYAYILSEGSYYGALLYAPDKSFIGFYGANTVTNNILGVIQSLFNRVFPNNAKAANSKRVLPDPFSDLVIDRQGFIYTSTESRSKGQLKKLDPGAGNNILDSNSVNFIDDAVNRTYDPTGWGFFQRICGLDVDENGFMYCIDSTYGRVFVYDAECRMLTAFGGGMGNGTQQGTFINATAIAVKGDDVLVTDRTGNTLSVFRCTEYGKSVLQLTKRTIDGDYLECKEGWEKVLRYDKNLQIAYTGLARAYLADGNYQEAMKIAYEGYDRKTYSLAFEYQRKQWLSDHFSTVFIGAVFLIVLIVTFAVIIIKKKIVLIKNEKFNLMLQTLIHPGNAFEEIKEKGKGSLKLCVIVLLVYYVTAVTKVLWGGFVFTNFDPGRFNSLWVFIRSTGLIALWIAANWLVCTLLGGKGKFREIAVVTCYSLLPIIFGRILWTILSNFLLPTEVSFLNILVTASILYTALLLIIGMLRIHEFTMMRFVGTGVLTVAGMAAIAFLILLVTILIQQLGGFVATLLSELMM